MLHCSERGWYGQGGLTVGYGLRAPIGDDANCGRRMCQRAGVPAGCSSGEANGSAPKAFA